MHPVFKIGDTYTCRSFSNWDTVYSYTVVARTARFITVVDRWGEKRRCGVFIGRDGECALPQGKHANAPVITAHRPA